MRPDPSQEPLELDDDELEPIPDGRAFEATQSLKSVDLQSASVVSHASTRPHPQPPPPGPLHREPTEPTFEPDAYAGHHYGPGASVPVAAISSGFEGDPPARGTPTRAGRVNEQNRRNPTPSRRTGPPRPPADSPPPRSPRRRRRRDDPRIDENLGRVLGSYRILSLLGAGGMGQVYMAEHTMLGRKVALKLLRPEYAVKRDAVHRFFQEARAVNAIGHENIVDITDYVELDTGETFFIMELLEGQDLSDYLRKSDTPIPLHQAMQIALQVCDALHAAHQTKIIHRDLKPDNIFVVNSATKRWFVKLLDFGVAKLAGEASADASYQTAAGSVIGTPAYMSPEQATGVTVDERTDIYSLGAILYEMFTGHPVFRAKSFGEFVVKHMNDQPIPPRDLADAPKIPMALEAVILRCLEKDPSKRYPSVAELREDLARATATVDTAIHTIPPPRAAPQSSRRRSNLVVVPIALGVLALAVGAFLWASGMLGGDADPMSGTGGGSGGPIARHQPGVGTDSGTTMGSGVTAQPLPTPLKQATDETVLLDLRTRPSGADVYRSGEDSSLGKTPLKLRLPAGDKQVALVFKLDGYQDQKESVARRDQIVDIPLLRDQVARASTKGGTKAGRRVRRKRGQRKRAVAPVVVDPDHTKPVVEPKLTPKPKPKPKPKKINTTDQVDPFK